MNIGGFQKVDLVNFPGIMAATVFTMGCDCRCPYCHNPTLVESLEPLVLEEKVFSYLSERRGLLEGVVVSGGEPCLQKDLPDFLSALKKIGLKVKLDTNGSYPRMLSELITDGLVDYVAMDIKARKERYEEVAGIPASRVEPSVSLLLEGRVPYEFRTTCVEGLLSLQDILSIGTWIHGASLYCLQMFNPSVTLDASYKARSSFSRERLEQAAGALSGDVGRIVIR